MQTVLRRLLLFLLACVPVFAHSKDFSSNEEESYAIGVLLAKSIKDSGITVDFSAFAEGVKRTFAGDSGITEEEAATLVQDALKVAADRISQENLLKSREFLDANGKKKGVKTTKSGLQYEVITAGNGARPGKDSVVVVHYVGSLVDGTVFDSSRDRDEPASIPLEQVIPGWSEGLQLMRVGERARLFIPPDLGYGSESMMDGIPQNSVLVFDVELLEIEE